MRRRHGFTLVELMIVVAVIGILIALLVPVLTHLRKKARVASTHQLMQQVGQAMSHYLERYPLLGSGPDSDDFRAAPYRFLHHNFRAMDQDPLIELPLVRLSVGNGPYRLATSPAEAEQILDHFPAAGSNVIAFEVVNGLIKGLEAQARYYTAEIRMISTAGTPSKTADDLVWVYTKKTGEWRQEEKEP